MKIFESDTFLIIVQALIGILFIFFLIYNPIIKIKDGCWSWERHQEMKVFSLIDYYNMTCEQIKEGIILEIYYPMDDNQFDREIIYIMCGDKIISEEVMKCGRNCFKKEYVERCMK